MRISDCSSDVCSSYLNHRVLGGKTHHSAADSKIQKFVAFLPKREEHFSKPHHTIWSNLSEQRLFNAYRSRGSPLDRSTGRGLRSAEESVHSIAGRAAGVSPGQCSNWTTALRGQRNGGWESW